MIRNHIFVKCKSLKFVVVSVAIVNEKNLSLLPTNDDVNTDKNTDHDNDDTRHNNDPYSC